MREFQTVPKDQPVHIRYLPNLHILKENGSYQTYSNIQGTQITMESVFISRFTMNNIVLSTKTSKMLDAQDCLQNHIKNAKATKFLSKSAFYTTKGSTCKVLPFYDF